MMLFMFAAIIFTMASTTVSVIPECPSDQSVCLWLGLGEICSCSGSNSCIQDDAHKFEVALGGRNHSIYTCQQISAFRACAVSEAAMVANYTQVDLWVQKMDFPADPPPIMHLCDILDRQVAVNR